MRIHKIKDIFDWTRTFHDKLADEYTRLAQGHDRDRVGMLLNYLAEHERALSEAVKHYEEDAIHSELEIAYDPDLELPVDLEGLSRELDKVDTAGVLNLALQFHDMLVRVYQALAEKAPNPEIKGLFEDIVRHEIREKLRTARDAGRLEDI